MKFLTTTLFAAASLPLAGAFAPTSVVGPRTTTSSMTTTTALDATTSISFVKGLEEKVVPDVKLTRARDGSSGTATFKFQNPNVFDASTATAGDVTGMYMADEEGEIMTTDVNASFTNGKPQSIEAVLLMRSPAEWDRFMRWMERYAEDNGLGFNKA